MPQDSERPLAGSVYVGCSGWAYTSWKPDFYPAKVPSKKFLEYYATRLNSVEVNYTFRSLPTRSIVDSWLAATGPDFRFSFKAPQRITHILRLKNCKEALQAFANSIRPTAEVNRLGIVLFQLPPNFKADPALLDSFLAEAASVDLRLAFEFRHESWLVDDVYAVLKKYNTALCAAESDDLTVPEIESASFACYRFRKSDYSTKQLELVSDLLRKRAQRGDVFAYFKHEEEPTGALRATAVLERLQRA
jgi:uncharacterized protein YecE (DUF72 family)